MSNGKGTALVIVALIIGVAGLGVGTFSVIRYEVVEGPEGPEGPPGNPGLDGVDGIDGLDGINGTLDNLVAVWESLTGVGAPSTDYYIALGDIKVNQSDFFTLTVSNTTVNLTRAGWYRFTIRALWSSLVSGPYYYLVVEKNGATWEYLEYIANEPSPVYGISTFIYVLSDGDDLFSFRCATSGPAFQILPNQAYNQMVLEYVGEPM